MALLEWFGTSRYRFKNFEKVASIIFSEETEQFEIHSGKPYKYVGRMKIENRSRTMFKGRSRSGSLANSKPHL